MKCPFCGEKDDRVVDSRESRDGEIIRRRRQCVTCDRRFTSYEQIEDILYMVVKNDGSRQEFSRNKLLAGIRRACEKRPVSPAQLEAIADKVESTLHRQPEREMRTADIGGIVMESLHALDQVAYIRFASVYRRFEDVESFAAMVQSLPNHQSEAPTSSDEAAPAAVDKGATGSRESSSSPTVEPTP
ncbi:MAG: transcriptional regulator NrdR [Acidobacteriota bacterium]